LIAEANVDMRDYLTRTLSNQWSVTAASDGGEALALARSMQPDLILAGAMLPVLDGFALVRELRADSALKATPVVLVTARIDEEAAVKGSLAGADDYLAKPFSSRELVARVAVQLELSRVRRQGERQLHELFALVPVAVYSCDAEGRFSHWNRAAVELWGREPGAEDRDWALCGAPKALWPDGSRILPEASPMQQVLATGASVSGRELSMVRADGALVDVLMNIRALHDAGVLVGAVAAVVDVSARKHAERRLQTMTEELERSVAERSAAP
jgi:CheY-like chemotaxis protein